MDFAQPLPPHSLELIAGRGHYERVVSEVQSAKASVWIATANLKDLWVEHRRAALGRRKRFRSVLDAFAELAERGVELRILHAGYPSRAFRESFDGHPTLLKGGLQLRMCPRVHLKTVIVDGRFLYLGSANWTGAGLGAKGEGRRNFELGIVSQDETMLDQVQALYEHIWRGRPCADCRLLDQCEAPLSLPQARGPAAAREEASAPRR
jgi:phosphatidylserine/phosphatidylglycerophosphate/cardiolipin synthase-like enzyme